MSTDSASKTQNGHQDFDTLQHSLSSRYYEHALDDLAPKTIIIIPSLTMDQEVLATIKGAIHYEERMLCMLLLLRMPRTKLIYVTSVPIDNSIIDYYLHLLPGVTPYHARQRLTLLSCYDASHKSLTEKILDRPRLIRRIHEEVKKDSHAHIATFNVTEHEMKLALALNIPIFGCHPDLWYIGTKTGSREIFKKLGLNLPRGFENLKSEREMAHALADLKKHNPKLMRAVAKMNDGFSGEGNAIFHYDSPDAHDLYNADNPNLEENILTNLKRDLKIVAAKLSYDVYMEKFRSMGGIVEEFVSGDVVESPSVQCRINPVGESEVMSTHDQILGGEGGQVYLGAVFPAKKEYRVEIGAIGKKIADELNNRGVMGRFAVDFISVKQADGWKHYPIEINLRKGGTTHPFIMLQFLTDGIYVWQEGSYMMAHGQTRYYISSDNVQSDKYKGLTPHDLIDIAMCNHILYDGAKQTGVMFHMIGALSEYGKLGMVCIGKTVEEAREIYQNTIAVLDKECS
ncbi:MAG TPA: peptide ligase PGM1-related protein [Saprospiraceae bacterium]|nr:peptide ligase PGM1-related protein [Saprospiraceae bacterium]